MRKLLFIAAGALAVIFSSIGFTNEAQAQPYPYPYGYRRPPPPRYYAPPVRRDYAPPVYRRHGCVVRSVRVWNGYRHVWAQRRICR